MKKYFLAIILIAGIFGKSFAQDIEEITISKMRPADRLILGVFTDIWQDLPSGMKTLAINRGITIDYLQEFPISTSNFSVAAGLGFASHNLYSDHVYFDRDQTGAHEFLPVGDIYSTEYSNNKLSLNYINIPLEIRFRTRNTKHAFRIHAGIKAGLLVSAHTKYVGEIAPDKRETKLKEKKLENIEPFLVGFHGRIGYGRVNLNTFISLTDIFTENNAANASFMSVGLSFIFF
jgi:hypothetical protein